MRNPEAVKSTFRAVVSRAFGSAIITAASQAEEEGRPLSELQQIDLATMMLMAYHDAVKEFETSVWVEEKLDALRREEY